MGKLTNERRAELKEKSLKKVMERNHLNECIQFAFDEVKTVGKISGYEKGKILKETIEEEEWFAMDLIREGW